MAYYDFLNIVFAPILKLNPALAVTLISLFVCVNHYCHKIHDKPGAHEKAQGRDERLPEADKGIKKQSCKGNGDQKRQWNPT